MKDNDINRLLQSLDFDTETPSEGHRERFQEKLDQRSKKELKSSGMLSLWLPVLGTAASFLIAFMVFQGVFNAPSNKAGELASVSPEMENTQYFYSSMIKQELTVLEKEKSPETEKLVADALLQLEILENDYQELKTDLVKSGRDKRVIHAMISNFQKRIDLLNQVLEKVNTINALNKNPHEDNLL